MSTCFEIQSTLHTAIIMDGNGRWALGRGLPRAAGHRAGVEAARRVVDAAPEHGIGVLTLFAFSSDNWRREPAEVGALMRLLAWYLESQTERAVAAGVRVEAIGRRDRLPGSLAAAIAATEAATAGGTRLRLRVALDYSGRDAILAAAGGASELSRAGIDRRLGPPVDLLIRTGGERRLSDFLLWESAYAELVFSRVLWPDFGAAELAAAVRDFRTRDRRFGAVPPVAVHRSAGWLD
ncbi:MAG: di-trans,poly-cis-decaprenylcistransferase [Bryobacteraceae bacterium]|jgi:undecaprenyl diphosphate synthase